MKHVSNSQNEWNYYIVHINPLPTKDVYIRPLCCHATTEDVYIRPQPKDITESLVVRDALNKSSPVVEKVWHYFRNTADPIKLLFARRIYKMAACVREGRMDTDEAIAEIFADRDSDVSDLSNSELKPSDSEESEQKQEEGGEEEASIDRIN